jgi:hypothetical protein
LNTNSEEEARLEHKVELKRKPGLNTNSEEEARLEHGS